MTLLNFDYASSYLHALPRSALIKDSTCHPCKIVIVFPYNNAANLTKKIDNQYCHNEEIML